MDVLELSEIRARLRASAQDERTRAARPLAGLLRGLMPRSRDRNALPQPRRVGLRPPQTPELETLLLEAVEPSVEARRDEFGRRGELAAPEPERSPVEAFGQGPVPAFEDPYPVSVLHRLGLGRPAPAQPVETPYLPEDLADHGGLAADELYEASGLFGGRVQEAVVDDLTPEQELLLHLERVLLAEAAALIAVRG